MTIQRDSDLILRIIEESDEPQQRVADGSLQFDFDAGALFMPEDESSSSDLNSWSNNSSVPSLSVREVFEPTTEELEQQIRDIVRLAAEHPRRAPRRNRDVPTINELNAFGNDSFAYNQDRMERAQNSHPRRRWTRRDSRASTDQDQNNNSSSSRITSQCNSSSCSSLGGQFAHDSLKLIRRRGASPSGQFALLNGSESQSVDFGASDMESACSMRQFSADLAL